MNSKSHKITALVLALSMAIFFVPAAAAESEAVEAASVSNGQGFENTQQNGGRLFVGTARIPKENSESFAAVKYIYSDDIMLNEQSLDFIKSELEYFGIKLPENLTGGSVSDSNIGKTEDHLSVFACGSEANPTELQAFKAYDTVEKSFGNLFKGYIFSISSYASLKNPLEGHDKITLSEDGKTAQTSIVLGEDYVTKIVNGKPITILMINSELNYSFCAPKITFVKDENYIVSPSDIYSPSTTDAFTYSTTASSAAWNVSDSDVPQITAAASPELIAVPTDEFTSSDTQTSYTDPQYYDSSTTNYTSATSNIYPETTSSGITADASPELTTAHTDEFTSSDAQTSYTDPQYYDSSTTNYTSATSNIYPETSSSGITADASPELTTAHTDEFTSSDTQTSYTDPQYYDTSSTAFIYSASTTATDSTTAYSTEAAPAKSTEVTTTSSLSSETQTTSAPAQIIEPFGSASTTSNTMFGYAAEKTLSSQRAIVNTKQLPLNIRSGPGMNYMVVTVLPRGTYVTVLDTENPDWYMVKTMGRIVGYAYSKYIRIM